MISYEGSQPEGFQPVASSQDFEQLEILREEANVPLHEPLPVDYNVVFSDVSDDLASSSSEPEAACSAVKTTGRKRKNQATDDATGTKRRGENFVYRFKGDILVKNFKGQKIPDRCGEVSVESKKVADISAGIWEQCRGKVYRGVTFHDSPHEIIAAEEDRSIAIVKWDDELPNFENRGRFMYFLDVKSKRSHRPDKVDSKTLLSWEGKEISVVILKYSDAVTTLKRWNTVQNNLLRPKEKDRAGAASVSAVNAVQAELKKQHGKYLCSENVGWYCWASFICEKPLDERDELIRSAPPTHLVDLFTTVPVHSDVLLDKARLDLQVANTVNEAYGQILPKLNEDIAQVQQIFDSKRRPQKLLH
ncbi:conserved hypothetical protein [Culex quinquefasciatus]|uniref:Uncharacterized protein n=1 Tax=Culex quinquefasciatus TaxID=7176 RepID=B0WEG1_CULQU|nr:conserved hypothetical protein [Culex quinquefasciatus]|eukprot:XP_001847095.1 conserved hypothetical protein [Culex quinquefasciatus]